MLPGQGFYYDSRDATTDSKERNLTDEKNCLEKSCNLAANNGITDLDRTLYIIAGPNGAGKTTASLTVLPEMWHCEEFVNADEIAHGLSPLNPEGVAFLAGRLMLERIDYLLNQGVSFSIETTLASRSYSSLVKRAQEAGYSVQLLFLWLDNPEIAVLRVKTRVKEGGHNIPEEVIRRRYWRGIHNFFELFKDNVDFWTIVDNNVNPPIVIADKNTIYDENRFSAIRACAQQ